MLQAVIVVGLVLGRAVVRDMYPADQAASQIGYVTMGMAVVPMIGPGPSAACWTKPLAGRRISGSCSSLGIMVHGPHMARSWARRRAPLRPVSRRAVPRIPPELLTRAASGATAWPRPSPRGAFFAYLGGAPYVGSEVFRLSLALVRFLLRRAGAGVFLRQLDFQGVSSGRAGINAMILWGTGESRAAGAADVRLSCILLALPRPLLIFRLNDLRGLRQRHGSQTLTRGCCRAPAPGGVRPRG